MDNFSFASRCLAALRRANSFSHVVSETGGTGARIPSRRLVALLLVGCGSQWVGCAAETDSNVASSRAALTAQCEQEESVPADAWVCTESRTVTCDSGYGDTAVDVVYVPGESTSADACEAGLEVSDQGPFAPGTHDISVYDESGAEICTTELTVVDEEPPTLEPQIVQLWPPNHKLHTLDVSECVQAVDACDGELRGEFIWASSDEPENDKGDGNHEPDIIFDGCQTVSLRAERQGTQDGRVYRLGVRVTDGAGHVEESECTVLVAHDMRGVDAAESTEAYRVEPTDSDGAVCDGMPEPGEESEPEPQDDDGVDEDQDVDQADDEGPDAEDPSADEEVDFGELG